MNLSIIIQKTQEEIEKLTKTIASLKDDKEKRTPLEAKKAKLVLELGRLIRQQWEETYERLDLSDDR
jgi:hypothetical protein